MKLHLAAAGAISAITLTLVVGYAFSSALEPNQPADGNPSPNNRGLRQLDERTPRFDLGTRSGPAVFPDEFRTIDGWGNNLEQPEWGAAGTHLIRISPAEYADGSSAPSGHDRPNPRVISQALFDQPGDLPNPEGLNDMFWQWGQFLDHDLDETPITEPNDFFNIPVPTGDPFFDPASFGTREIRLVRSEGHLIEGVREQFNNLTSFIDASQVYGSDTVRALALRTLDGTGRLKTSDGDLPPFNYDELDNAPNSFDILLFVTGDIRTNEQLGLIAMHTVFIREHNHWADHFATLYPDLSGDEIYEYARAIVGAQMQAITYREFLPILLGPDAMPPYAGYDPTVHPAVSNEFATAAFRVGHTMLSPTLARIAPDGSEAPEGNIPLRNSFFNPFEVELYGIDSLLRGLLDRTMQDFDRFVISDVRNFLFGDPGSTGFDLVSLNIQRGRDHGLASYNTLRQSFGLAPRTSFDEISPEPYVQQTLEDLYGSPDKIDAWVGMLMEPKYPGAQVGETIRAVLIDQFTRSRDGDRFWYESYLPSELVELINEQTLLTVICRNSGITEAQAPPAAFGIEPSIPCPADLDGNGVVDLNDLNLVLANFGQQVPQGDANGDGWVDLNDLNIVLSAFGTTCP